MKHSPSPHFFASLVLSLALAHAAVAQAAQPRPAAPAPPVAKRESHPTTLHGRTLVDDYFWLRDRDKPEVRSYLEAENAYAEAVMAPTAALQETLYREMRGRIQEADASAPARDGGWLYFERTEEGKQYYVVVRKRSETAPEEVVLDVNRLGEGKVYFAIGDFEISDDGRLLAYTTDDKGSLDYRLQLKDLTTGKLLPITRDGVTSLAWAADNKTLFYTTRDAAKRSYRLYRMVLGAKGPDTLLFEEKDERFGVGLDRTLSKAYVMLTSSSATTSEVRVVAAAQPTAPLRLIAPREQDHEYYVAHRGDDFWIITNSLGRTFGVVRAPVADPQRKNWKVVVPATPDVQLSDFTLLRDYLVLSTRFNALPHFEVIDLASGQSHRIEMPEPVYDLTATSNSVFDAKTFRFFYESPSTPPTEIAYDLATRQRTTLHVEPVRGDFDPKRYVTERLLAPAKDGTKVPVTLVYKKGVKLNGRAPLYLRGYGSYGASYDANFSSERLTLLDRGVIYAVAHVRGGGELGKAWHDAGRMRNKLNTFTDFIAVAEYLVKTRYTSKNRLVAEGRSAGGLLMGAITNLRPDLFKAVIAGMPFVDVINTMLDESLPLTVEEFEEWGNPKVQGDFEYMIRYSPYDNLAPRKYPAMLVRTGLNDSQVSYWEPAKYVARMRAVKQDKNPVLLVTNMAAGHRGASGRFDDLREYSYDFAFALWQMGITK